MLAYSLYLWVCFCLLYSLVYFLDSTSKWYHTVFIFLYLTYFTQHNIFQMPISILCLYNHHQYHHHLEGGSASLIYYLSVQTEMHAGKGCYFKYKGADFKCLCLNGAAIKAVNFLPVILLAVHPVAPCSCSCCLLSHHIYLAVRLWQARVKDKNRTNIVLLPSS